MGSQWVLGSEDEYLQDEAKSQVQSHEGWGVLRTSATCTLCTYVHNIVQLGNITGNILLTLEASTERMLLVNICMRFSSYSPLVLEFDFTSTV